MELTEARLRGHHAVKETAAPRRAGRLTKNSQQQIWVVVISK